MSSITDDYMHEVLKTVKPYTVVVIKSGPKANEPGADKQIWEHGRMNLELRKEGMLDLIIGLRDEGEIEGLEVFNTSVGETRRVMEDDPAVRAGVLTCEIHPAVSFPGDALSG
jgi:hypothetical protein